MDKDFKILVIDDEADLAEQVAESLELEGFSTRSWSDSMNAIHVVNDFKPDIILLDKNMPGKDGIDILKEVRGTPEFSEIPILMVTACNTKFDKLWSYSSGADDYILKPFDIDELSMKLKALIRKFNLNVTRSISFDGININTSDQHIKIANKSVPLTNFEFNFLKTLIEKKGSVLHNTEIEELLKREHLSSKDQNKLITNLLSKLENIGSKIKVVRDVGYRFVA